MARKDYYDWRGLAMFTQQMGQLFEPSKAKLLSKQQDHEMNMLMAKKAWETQSESLKLSREKYNTLQTQIAAAEKDLMERALPELVEASGKDSTYTGQSADVLQNTTGKKLEELHALALDARKRNESLKAVLENMVGFEVAALSGEKFGKDYKGAKGAKNYLKIYDTEPETPGWLSPDERGRVKHAALNDMFLVEDIENKVEGTDYITVYADNKPVNVRPEGLAFVAGFESTGASPAEIRSEKAVKARAAYGKPQQTLDEWLNIDSAWMDLTADDQKTVAGALKHSDQAKMLSPALKDTYLAMKKRDELSVTLMRSDLNDRIQPLSDEDFQPEDAPYWGTGDIQKPWVTLGLNQEMYSSLRKLGSKGGNTRGAFEHLIRNWENINDNLKIVYANQIKLQHSQLVGI